MRRGITAVAGLLLAACGGSSEAPGTPKAEAKVAEAEVEPDAEPGPAPDLSYVGTKACAQCHQAALEGWSGSHHDLAMQEPEDSTVLGDFGGTSLSHGKETFRFSRAGAGYQVEVTGPDGKAQAYPVRYTFGAQPLQQYLVDVGQGKLQALLVAWDARPQAEGGQRWFHLQPDDYAPPGDPLHWMAPVYTWNTSCADCHSTGVRKGYDRANARFDTTFAEVDVGCEACHGQGSHHVETARAGQAQPMPFSLTKPQGRHWVPSPDRPISELQGSGGPDPELERCAPCHSRRAELGDPGAPFHDAYRLALLDEGLYFANGQIDDEVFVYGSFLQSKMHAAGVVCSDCHDPHSLQLRAQGNTLCSMCHRPDVFDTPQHHFHPAGSEGAQCVACHMPKRTYMELDTRGDHRFGVPQPQLAAKLGAPDPCKGCHADWSPQQAAAAIAEHGGGKRSKKLPEAMHAARGGDPRAAQALLSVVGDDTVPTIVRATALVLAARSASPPLMAKAAALSKSPDPLLRRTAAQVALMFPPPQRDATVVHLLDDPVRSVRLEAVGSMLGGPASELSGPDAKRFRAAVAEYRQAQEAGTDRAQGLVNLAGLLIAERRLDEAQKLLEDAIALEPAVVTAHVNLADLHRAAGREAEAESALRRALDVVGDTGPVHHSLGLALIRSKRTDEALRELEAAYRTREDISRYGLVYAVALHDTKRVDDALEVLQKVAQRHPGDPDVLATMAQYAAEAGRTEDAERYRAALAGLGLR